MSNDVQFNLRIPAELKQLIADSAKANSRSINAEAQLRLEESFKKPSVRITDYDGLAEPAMTIELPYATIGLMQSRYSEVTLQSNFSGRWILSYQALRCTIDDADAKLLIQKGCTLL